MGYMRHHAIIVTSFNVKYAAELRDIAAGIFGDAVTDMLHAKVNGYYSFMVGPDGSKEGWQESEDGDKRRDRFIAELRAAYKRGVYCKWVEVQYGDDNQITEALRSSDGDEDDDVDE
jgi:hypothetical protein